MRHQDCAAPQLWLLERLSVIRKNHAKQDFKRLSAKDGIFIALCWQA